MISRRGFLAGALKLGGAVVATKIVGPFSLLEDRPKVFAKPEVVPVRLTMENLRNARDVLRRGTDFEVNEILVAYQEYGGNVEVHPGLKALSSEVLPLYDAEYLLQSQSLVMFEQLVKTH